MLNGIFARLPLLFGLVFTSPSLGILWAQAPFEPEWADPLLEPWRWKLLEGMEFRNSKLEFGPVGEIWVLKNAGGLHRFDGIQARRVHEWGDEDGPIHDIGATGPDRLLILAAGGVFELAGGESNALLLFPAPVTAGMLEFLDRDHFWAATPLGIFQYRNGEARRFIYPELATGGVRSLSLGKDGALYFVSAPTGHVFRCPLVEGGLSENSAWEVILEPDRAYVHSASLLSIHDGRIWYINTNESTGAQEYDPERGVWRIHDFRSMGGENFNSSLMESRDGKIWVAGRGSLQVYDGTEWSVYKAPDLPIPDSQPQVYQDAVGQVYLLEVGAGVYIVDYEMREYRTFKSLHFGVEAQDGSRWYLHVDGRVVREAPLENRWEQFSPERTGVANPVAVELIGGGGDVLVAGSTDEVATIGIYSEGAWEVRRFPGFAVGFGFLGVKRLQDGSVILGAGQDPREYPNIRGGALRVLPGTGKNKVEYLAPGVVPFRTWCVAEDPSRGGAYVSGHGLNWTDLSGTMVEEVVDAGTEWLDSVAVTRKGEVWAAIWGKGVFRLGRKGWENLSDPVHFPERHTSLVFAGEEDDYPILATDDGFFRYDGTGWHRYLDPSFSIYRTAGTLKRMAGGSLWINTTHTDWYYRGLRSEPYPVVKRNVFKTVQVIPDRHGPVTKMDARTPKLFPVDEVVLEWSGTDHQSKTRREDLTYSHSLDGGPWSPFTRENRLRLDKLVGGKHEIRIRARDSDFNVERSPLIHGFSVVVPLWRQPWFFAGLLAVGITLVGLLVYIFSERMRHVLEMERLKLRFFTNLSHELRTPLTLIQGPLEKLLRGARGLPGEERSLLRTAQVNTTRLLNLIDQLLEFRRVEGGQLSARPRAMELVGLVRNVMASFEFVARDKRQRVYLRAPFHSCAYLLDEDLYFKILNNLIFNATKFSGQGGTIEISLNLEKSTPETGGSRHELIIVVSDDGRGIDPELLPHIFQPFYQSGQKPGSMNEGFGIGLALVKEHVRFLGGSIRVASPRPGHATGTAFTVRLPVENPRVVQADEPLVLELLESSPDEGEVWNGPVMEEAEAEGGGEDSRPHLHLVEDNLDVRDFLRCELSRTFRVTVSTDGTEAEATIRQLVPDLVITDVMLPGSSGFDLCKNLKEDPVCSHIPVIMLTAFKTLFHEQKGLEMGADDFIAKPVSLRVLHLKIANLMAARERMRQSLRKEFGLVAPSERLPASERAFLEQVNAIAREHLSDEFFGVEQFAEEMGMSRSNFYKKFKDLTGMSPAAFLKIKRLNEAARLILQGYGNITQVALEVGFSEISYFSRCFKEHFQCSPSQYKKEGGLPNKTKSSLKNLLTGAQDRKKHLN